MRIFRTTSAKTLTHQTPCGTRAEITKTEKVTRPEKLANEGLSILENAGELGLPLPKTLKSALEKMKDEKPEDVPAEEQE